MFSSSDANMAEVCAILIAEKKRGASVSGLADGLEDVNTVVCSFRRENLRIENLMLAMLKFPIVQLLLSYQTVNVVSLWCSQFVS